MKSILRILEIILVILVVVILVDVTRIALFYMQEERIQPGVVEIATPADMVTYEKATSTDEVAEIATPMDVTTEDEKEDKDDNLPVMMSIDMELVYQHPELPTGCESVALTMLLKYYGFDLDKTTIASEYLVYSDNFVEGYLGNPFSYGGAGIYSPGLTKTANIYLNDQETMLNAKNISGSSPETLYKYVANDTPVVIWNTVYMLNNNPTGFVLKYGAKEYEWDSNEHCMVLTGYDLEKNIVIIHDPIEGVVERDADAFWERYRNLGSMAIIIR